MSTSRVPNLRRLRTERQLTQAQLASVLSVTTRTIIRWENGDGEPGISELSGLAKFFSISVDQLVNDLLVLAPTEPIPSFTELTDRQLDLWVAKSQGMSARFEGQGLVYYEDGHGERPVPRYSTEWVHGGPIIHHNSIHLAPVPAGGMFDGRHLDQSGWIARCSDKSTSAWGLTPLEAGMRAFVLARVTRRLAAGK